MWPRAKATNCPEQIRFPGAGKAVFFWPASSLTLVRRPVPPKLRKEAKHARLIYPQINPDRKQSAETTWTSLMRRLIPDFLIT